MTTSHLTKQERTVQSQAHEREEQPKDHDLVAHIDAVRVATFESLPEKHRSQMGQYGTPPPIGCLMASMFDFSNVSDIRLLDAGAGVGTLSACFVVTLLQQHSERKLQPASIHLTAFEAEPRFLKELEESLVQCKDLCEKNGIPCEFQIIPEDFIHSVVLSESDLLFQGPQRRFNFAIQNPPYKKINAKSEHRKLLRRLGVEAPNLYTAFLSLTTLLLEPEGQLVAITPRSFCNGLYFEPFRKDFLSRMALQHIHVFDSRSEIFKEDNVLQENIIFHAKASAKKPRNVRITSSGDLDRKVSYTKIVPPEMKSSFLHIITDENSENVVEQMGRFGSSLTELGVNVSTGRVVDFRAKEHLKQDPEAEDIPLLYPMHLQKGDIVWPIEKSKKPNALSAQTVNEKLLVPSGVYVLVKRFSSKEQARRIEATLFDSEEVKPGFAIGIENHLNYIHSSNRGLERDLAAGLTLYLNSSLIDMYFRLFSGHTQVNATDLRNLPFPTKEELVKLSQKVGSVLMSQKEMDQLIREELLDVGNTKRVDPVASIARIKEAQRVLKQRGFPQQQTNIRSALTLLSLLDLKPGSEWKNAGSPLLGITEMMNYFSEHYGKTYSPRFHETVKRSTLHPFLEAGLIVKSPNVPEHLTSIEKHVYQISHTALEELRRTQID